MATIVKTSISNGYTEITTTTLDGSGDTFEYSGTEAPLLIFSNDSGSTITPNILGDEATTVECQGVGTIDVSGGISQAIADGESWGVRLGTISGYLSGNISITSGTGLKAQLIVK